LAINSLSVQRCQPPTAIITLKSAVALVRNITLVSRVRSALGYCTVFSLYIKTCLSASKNLLSAIELSAYLIQRVSYFFFNAISRLNYEWLGLMVIQYRPIVHVQLYLP